MIDALLAPFSLDFMVRGFIVAFVEGALCGAMGTYVVLRQLSFIGDGLAHASFAGIVIAYIKGLDYYIGAAVVAVATALGIGYVHRKGGVSLDTTIGVLFTGMFALGVFLMSRLRNYAVDLQGYLFGNILGVSREDISLILALCAVVIAALVLCYRPLMYASFDPIVAEASGIPVPLLDYVLLVLLALTIIVSISAVGIILVAALLVTPAAAAFQLTRRFAPMMATAAGLGCACAVGGLYLSYFLNASSGATIVLLATVMFFTAMAFGRAFRTRAGASRRQSASHR